ncbi:hypothetical protein R80B4_01682 [Fibrobacteres bacterium R8-0-B4]
MDGLTIPYRDHICKCILGQGVDGLAGWKIEIRDWLFESFTLRITKWIPSQLVEDELLYVHLDDHDSFRTYCCDNYSQYKVLNNPKQFNYDSIMKYYVEFVNNLVKYRNEKNNLGEFDREGINKLLDEFLENCWNNAQIGDEINNQNKEQ